MDNFEKSNLVLNQIVEFLRAEARGMHHSLCVRQCAYEYLNFIRMTAENCELPLSEIRLADFDFENFPMDEEKSDEQGGK